MTINHLVLERLQLRYNCLIIYSQWMGKVSKQLQQFRRLNILLQQSKSYGGTVTKGAMKRITRVVNILCLYSKERWILNEVIEKTVKHKLSFITLTITDNTKNISAQVAYETLLSKFLDWMTKTKGVKAFIWKAELQKRGQIHYHITTPSFLNWKEIRQKWNRLQTQAGYLDDFIQKHKHNDPNSTDVHEVYKVNDLTSYLIKYLAKKESHADATTGKIWDASMNLKTAKLPSFDMINDQYDFLQMAKDNDLIESIPRDQCTIVKSKGAKGYDLLCQQLLDEFNSSNPLLQSVLNIP